MSLGVLLLLVALVLTIYTMVVQGNFRTPIAWAVLLVILALMLPLTRTFVVQVP